MEIIFVGTGSGKTDLNRFHSSILIKTDYTSLLVDAGDSVSRAVLKAGLEYDSIDAIFITHTHADHFCGLPSLITQMKMNGRISPLKILIHTSLLDAVKQFLRQSYIFEARLGFEIIFIPLHNSEKNIIDEKLSLLTFQNSHLDKYISFNSDSYLSLSSQSALFFAEGKTILYTGDIGGIKDLELFNNERIDYLICETSHITPAELDEFLKNSKPVKTFLTHIDDSDFIIKFSALVNGSENNIIPTHDGMTFPSI